MARALALAAALGLAACMPLDPLPLPADETEPAPPLPTHREPDLDRMVMIAESTFSMGHPAATASPGRRTSFRRTR